MTVIQNLDHQRASYAYKCIKNLKGKIDTEKEKRYHSAVRSSGVLIQNAGLMQTLSFYISKKGNDAPSSPESDTHPNSSEFNDEKYSSERKDNLLSPTHENWRNLSHYELLAEHILKWILFSGDNDSSILDMYQNLLEKEDEEIICKTQEAKSFILWLKRFSDSILESGD